MPAAHTISTKATHVGFSSILRRNPGLSRTTYVIIGTKNRVISNSSMRPVKKRAVRITKNRSAAKAALTKVEALWSGISSIRSSRDCFIFLADAPRRTLLYLFSALCK